MYVWLKILHIVFATISVTGFAARGVLAMRHSPLLQQRWIRVVPHVNDTLLLAAGIALALATGQYPFADDWLTAKLMALVLYVVLGAMALRPVLRPALRVASGLAALTVFAYMVSVAITKSPIL
jgi:uncharacterized membrane protein SirB2